MNNYAFGDENPVFSFVELRDCRKKYRILNHDSHDDEGWTG